MENGVGVVGEVECEGKRWCRVVRWREGWIVNFEVEGW